MMDLEEYRLIIDSSPNMIWRANLTKECDYFNKTWLKFTGRSFEEEYGYGWAEGVHPDDYDRCVDIYVTHFDRQEAFEMDYRLKRWDGEYRWINDIGVPIYDRNNKFVGFIGSCMDVTEKIEGQILKELAQNDLLCNTYNRQYSLQLLENLFSSSLTYEAPFSLLMMDIDDFKNINDRYGHQTGDKVLSSIGLILRQELRNEDIIGRYGGDEFIIGLPATSNEEARAVAERISLTLATHDIEISGAESLRFTVSIGVKTLEEENSIQQFINNADMKLYEAKKNGKNIVGC